MLYPNGLLEGLGEILLQVDFIGPRFIKGNPEPLHFLSCKYVRPFKLHVFIRIKAQTTTEVLNALTTLFFVLQKPIPDIIQMDNDSAFRGFIERKSCIGRLVRWACANRIIPLFNAPSSPWNNGSNEGGNNVFDKKFWQGFEFSSFEELDQKLKKFNQAYEIYLIPDYEKLTERSQLRLQSLTVPTAKKKLKLDSSHQPNIYLLRIVKEQFSKCQIEVLNNYITLPDKYKGQFVLVHLNLIAQHITIIQEVQGKTIRIYSSPFYVQI